MAKATKSESASAESEEKIDPDGDEKDSNPGPEKVDECSTEQSALAKKKSCFVLSDLSFEELKQEVRMMPTVLPKRAGLGCGERGRSSSEGGVGSMTEHRLENVVADVDNKKPTMTAATKKSAMRQQFSLNDELLSRERLQVRIPTSNFRNYLIRKLRNAKKLYSVLYPPEFYFKESKLS